jgi:hypothetical protein
VCIFSARISNAMFSKLLAYCFAQVGISCENERVDNGKNEKKALCSERESHFPTFP